MAKKSEMNPAEKNTMLLWAPPGSPTLKSEQLVVWLSVQGEGPATVENVRAWAAEGGVVELNQAERKRAVAILNAKEGKVLSLLLKARKGADSGFGPSDWALVFAVLGFGFEVEKEEREIVGAKVTLLDGQQLHIVKPGNYRRIVFYGIHVGEWYGTMTQWCKERGFSVSDLASKAMCVLTMEKHNELREYKARDYTNTGTCGICNANVKRSTSEVRGGLVLHGYQRPGDGYVHGRCFGVDYPPHELTPEACRDFIPLLERELAGHNEYLRSLLAGEVKKLAKQPPSRFNEWKGKYVCEGEPEWSRYLESEVGTVRGRIAQTEGYIKHFQEKVANWKLDTLPEEKIKERIAELERRGGRILWTSEPRVPIYPDVQE